MGRNKSAYQCIKKRKRKNNDALRKATQARLALLAVRKYQSEKKLEEEHELALAPATTSDCMHTKYSISDDNMSLESNLQEHELALAPPTTSDFTHTKTSISDGNISLESNVQDEDSDSSILVETGNASSLKEIVDVIDTIVGNRIINFRYFWKQIMTIAEHGEKFNCKLNYLKVVKEKQIGLISTFELKCALCRSKFVIKTEETQQSNFDLNAKTVSGTIMVGIGLSNLNELIASMDLPTLSFRLYSKVHDSVSDMWKTAADETMLNAAKDEIEAAKLRGDVSKTGIAMIAVEADACWSKRSYKNNYSALSGVAAIIGEYTGKVLHIGVRNKFCMICTRASKKGETPRTHKCTKNHSGSSTSMEQTILVEGFKKSINERNLIYKTLIADGDSSTYKSILESRPYADVPIQKIECTNHLLRNYNGKNLLLQKDTTVPLAERKLLTNDRLTRLRTAVRSAIKFRKDENKTIDNKIESLQKDIINSPRHIFGDHTQCDDYYCTEERKNEPNLVPQAYLLTLMLKLQRNASQLAFNSRSLLHCFTNNRAEQFNSIVAKMVGGKRVNFSIKDSYTTRCYAAVVAFNTGKPQYVLYKSVINKSPGKSLKRLEARRNAKNCREVKARAKMSRKKLHYAKVDKDYGVACERPDMSDEDFEGAKKAFLDNLKEQASNRRQIERSTILQAESSLWLELRRCLLTASTFGKICKRRPNQNSAPLVKALLYSYDLSNIASVKHGKENEEKALLQLSVQENIHINKCGLFIHKDYCFLAATPDGVFDNGIVEIKCPSSAFGVDPETALKQKKLKCFKLNEKNEYILNPNNDWFYQVQGQLNVADKHVCLFAVWTGAEFPLKVVRVYRDEEFWRQKMLPKLIQFYDKCILPELIDPRKARSMQLREIFL